MVTLATHFDSSGNRSKYILIGKVILGQPQVPLLQRCGTSSSFHCIHFVLLGYFPGVMIMFVLDIAGLGKQ